MEWGDYKLLLQEYLYLFFSGMEHSLKKPNAAIISGQGKKEISKSQVITKNSLQPKPLDPACLCEWRC